MLYFFFFKQKTAYEISACLVGSEMCIRDRFTMLVLKLCIGVIVWLVIITFILGTTALGALFYQKYAKYNEQNVESQDGSSNVDEDTKKTNKEAFMGLFIFFWAVAAISFLLVCCFFNRIRLVIAILKAAADFVKDVCSALLVPPVMFTFQIMLYVSWLITLVYLYSTGEQKRPQEGWPFASIEVDQRLEGQLAYHLFGLLWINAFIIALGQFILASSAGIWYFMRQQMNSPVRTSVFRALRYHMGSLAFGSLILAIVQFIRITFEYIKKKSYAMGVPENAVTKFIFKCMKCCLACFERFIKFINTQAYIQVALTGKSFCSSAIAAFYLIFRNTVVFGMTHGLSIIFVFVGKLFITVIPTIAGFLVITQVEDISKRISSPISLCICFAFISYAIGSLFMQVWGMASETILQAYLVDIEVNANVATNCPASLQEFVDKNKKIKDKTRV
eukprot:TRINITY_DN6683_c0_g1_i32.p1 TRINITY_DN6683_c0_g1~~TRINITY_DN6683_c0_g1_i32.p1  ORF type:complete len:447 (-),score=91.79 TRINITY_DN6683_c0_g1_i32:100-1440(-)